MTGQNAKSLTGRSAPQADLAVRALVSHAPGGRREDAAVRAEGRGIDLPWMLRNAPQYLAGADLPEYDLFRCVWACGTRRNTCSQDSSIPTASKRPNR